MNDKVWQGAIAWHANHMCLQSEWTLYCIVKVEEGAKFCILSTAILIPVYIYIYIYIHIYIYIYRHKHTNLVMECINWSLMYGCQAVYLKPSQNL